MSRVVGMDARMWNHAGIGRYVRELSVELLRIAPPNRFLFFGQETVLRPVLGVDASIEKAEAPIYGWAEQVEMARLSGRIDLLHTPHFNAPFFSRKPFIATVHDLIYLRERGALKNPLGRAYVQTLLGHIARRAALILTVSEATKNDIRDYFPSLDPSRIEVTYEAASRIFRPLGPTWDRSEFLSRYQIAKPFVLYVGSLKPHKNVSTLIRAMKQLRNETKLDVEVILVGRSDPKYPELLSEISKETDSVRYLGELPDEELVCFYNCATALVLPSFAEGFGLPVLEAMACGTPVVLSRRASLPEIAGEAGLYFEPDRVDALSALLYTVFSDKDLRQKMSQSCLMRAARFTWERTARQTLAAYDRILG